LFDGGGVAVAHHGEGGEEVGAAAERELPLVFDELEERAGVAGVLFNVLLRLGGGVVANGKEGSASDGGSEQDEEEKELRAQAEFGQRVPAQMGERVGGK